MKLECKTNVTKEQLFQSCCYFYKKNRTAVKKSEEKPTNILTNEAQESLKKVATLKNDHVMLGATKDVDLITAEFKKDRKCYREYTRIFSETNNKEGIKELEPVYEEGAF